MYDSKFFVVVDLRKLPPAVLDSFKNVLNHSDSSEDAICFYDNILNSYVHILVEALKYVSAHND